MGKITMLNIMVRTLLCLIVVALVGCAGHTVSAKTERSLAVCKMDCQQGLKRCSQVCYNDCHVCSLSARNDATNKYNTYAHEQSVQGESISRELKSYQDPLQCHKTTCDCNDDYTTCMASCKGIIHKSLQVAPACC